MGDKIGSPVDDIDAPPPLNSPHHPDKKEIHCLSITGMCKHLSLSLRHHSIVRTPPPDNEGGAGHGLLPRQGRLDPLTLMGWFKKAPR